MSVLKNYTDIKPDVIDTVEFLRKNNVKIRSTTGYTKEMMNIVISLTQEKGYIPDLCVCTDDVNGKGRSYLYMIFKNMEILGLEDVRKIIKFVDTVADIVEVKNIGVYSTAVIVGSSQMGLSQKQFDSLTLKEKILFVKKLKWNLLKQELIEFFAL